MSAILPSRALARSPRGLETGFADPVFAVGDPASRRASLDRTVEARGSLVRLTIAWSLIAPRRPANATNPGDPAYSFSALDAIVKDVVARGLTPLITVMLAPAWAEGANRPVGATPGSWRPNPTAFGQFAEALARRYGGAFVDSASGLPLPRVSLFQAWNEENLPIYLAPQWRGRKSVAPALYRRMLNAFYAGAHAVHRDNLVLSGGTAPYGDRAGGPRTRPVAFWRAVLCLRRSHGGLRRTGCTHPAEMDILAHHPISTVLAPAHPARNPDDAASADLGRIRRVLRAAERRRTIRPRGRRPLWATEFWWDTNPPDAAFGVSPQRQARFIEQSLFLIWRGGGSAAINLQVDDLPVSFNPRGQVLHTGIFNSDGSPKPSFTAFRFPFVAQRRSRGRALAWGKAPVAGRLSVERRARSAWIPLRSFGVSSGEVFALRLKARGRATLRASVGGESSLPWSLPPR